MNDLKNLCFFVGLFLPCMALTQTNDDSPVNNNPTEIFEKEDPKQEIQRLEFKKAQLNNRLDALKNDPAGHEAEIENIEGMIAYIDRKISENKKILLSEEYAENIGVPEKGTVSDETYENKKSEAVKGHDDSEMKIHTTLTQEEFNKLPKERQEKILSMPERYTILK